MLHKSTGVGGRLVLATVLAEVASKAQFDFDAPGALHELEV